VKDSGHGEKLARQVVHPVPFLTVLLTAPLKRAPPEVEDRVTEGAGRAGVGGRGKVVEAPRDRLPSHRPCSAMVWRLRRRSPSLTGLSFARMRSARVFRSIWKSPLRALPQMKVKPRKAKVSGLRKAPPFAFGRGKAAEFDKTGLVRMQRQSKLP
jgi:hypothetical protein